jgi:hypothetical protein
MTLGCLHEISPGCIQPLARAFRASTSHSDLSVKVKFCDLRVNIFCRLDGRLGRFCHTCRVSALHNAGNARRVTFWIDA